MFREKELHVALITETWFQDDRYTQGELADISAAEKIDFICKNRSSKRGGGVAIAYDRTKANLKKLQIRGNKYEMVGAVGNISVCTRKCVFFSVYVLPKQTAEETRGLFVCLGDAIEKAKQDYIDPIIIVGGDTNRRDLSPAISDFPDIRIEQTGPTRGNVALDIIATNINPPLDIETFFPLETFHSESQSDHLSLVAKARLQRLHTYTTTSFQTRRYTEEAEVAFGADLAMINWEHIIGTTPTESADKLDYVLQFLYNKHFPLQTVTKRSCDPPWMTKRIRRYIRNRKRENARSGRSRRWKKKKEKCDRLIEEAKKSYIEKIKKKIKDIGNTKCYYKAVTLLQSAEAPIRWAIQSMFPELTDQEIAEKAAIFFNEISQEYNGVDKPSPVPADGSMPEMFQISARLKSMKKPRSIVKGDIDPRLVAAFADLIAIPLHTIFCQIQVQREWPSLWNTETVTLIPKTSTPTSLAQLRNLSCTPLFSKCLETFILEDLKRDVSLGKNQFGGIKGTGVNHFLVETWDEILSALEDPNAAATLMSIDYEKAFNRMSHVHCLQALKKYGASERAVGLVHSFLYGRKMRVKVGSTLSAPRTVPGGSPQGSILGNFLFCVATREMGEIQEAEQADTTATSQNISNSTVSFAENGLSGSEVSSNRSNEMSPISRPGTEENVERDVDEEEIEIITPDISMGDESFDFRYFKKRPTILEDTVMSERFGQHDIDRLLGVPNGWVEKPLAVKVYIDDLNNIEKVKQSTAVSVISEAKTILLPHAIKLEENFIRIKQRAELIGMKVNSSKTQLLCISGNSAFTVKAYIRTETEEIRSGEELKILGFWFGPKPNVNLHVEKMLAKFRTRLWSLRHLKKSGMSPADLLLVFTTILRPVLDFAAPAYHPLLTVGQTKDLEMLQKKALKIVYGPTIRYEEALALANLTTLEERRETLVTNFAISAERNPRYTDGWFPKKLNQKYSIRKPRPYMETKSKTERMRKNPINYMRRLLNDLQ